jgi:hypothetical protein
MEPGGRGAGRLDVSTLGPLLPCARACRPGLAVAPGARVGDAPCRWAENGMNHVCAHAALCLCPGHALGAHLLTPQRNASQAMQLCMAGNRRNLPSRVWIGPGTGTSRAGHGERHAWHLARLEVAPALSTSVRQDPHAAATRLVAAGPYIGSHTLLLVPRARRTRLARTAPCGASNLAIPGRRRRGLNRHAQGAWIKAPVPRATH